MLWIDALLLPVLTGWLGLSLWLRGSRLPRRELFSAAAGPLAGLSFCALALYAGTLIWGNAAGGAAPAFIRICFLAVLCARALPFWQTCSQQGFPRLNLKNVPFWRTAVVALLVIVFVLAVIHNSRAMWADMSWNPFGGWDARYFWYLKSRFLVRSPDPWPLLASPVLEWSNPDYPLHLPSMTAWGWAIFGREALVWPMLLAWLHWISLALLLIWYGSTTASAQSGLCAAIFLVSIPLYRFWAGTLYMDIPLAFYISTGALVLLASLRIRDHRGLLMAGFFTGLAAWTKNEGLFALLLLSGLAGAGVLVSSRSSQDRLRTLLLFLSGTLPGVLSAAYFKLAVSGTATLLLNPASDHNQDILSRFKVALAAWGFFKVQSGWNGLWLFGAAALVFSLGRILIKKSPRGLMLALFILLLEAGYLLVLVRAPHGIEYHIRTALMRLLLHTGVLTLAFCLDVFGWRSRPFEPGKR